MGNPAGGGGRLWLLAPALGLFLVVFAYPVFAFLLRSFSDPAWGLQNYETLAQRTVYLRVLWNTLLVSGSVTALCLLLGYPLAYTMAHAGPRMQRLLIFVVLIPFWTSLLVRTFAWMVLLQKEGLVNDALIWLGLTDQPLTMMYNRTGVLVGMVQVLLPFMVFPIFSVMKRIDPLYTEAASTLGARPATNFLRVYLPLSLPGVISGCMLVFVLSLGYYITPALLGGRGDTMIAQLIEQQVSEFGNWGLSSALGVVLLGSIAVIALAMQALLRLFRS